MVCKTESTEIDDHEYAVTQWSAEKSILMKLKLTKIFGPSLSTLVNLALDQNKEDQDVDESQILSGAISLLFDNSTPEEITAMIKSCVIGVARDGKKITETSFAELFTGEDLMLIYRIFFFVLKVNYGNLFKGQLVNNLLAKVKELS